MHLSRTCATVITRIRCLSSVRPSFVRRNFSHFRLLLWNHNGIQRNLTGSKISTPSTKFVFFGQIGKTRWPPWTQIGWDIFRLLLLLWNRWREFNETWQEARSRRPLPSLCFSGRPEKQDDRPGLWLAETCSTSPLKPLNGIQRNLIGHTSRQTYTRWTNTRPHFDKHSISI